MTSTRKEGQYLRGCLMFSSLRQVALYTCNIKKKEKKKKERSARKRKNAMQSMVEKGPAGRETCVACSVWSGALSTYSLPSSTFWRPNAPVFRKFLLLHPKVVRLPPPPPSGFFPQLLWVLQPHPSGFLCSTFP